MKADIIRRAEAISDLESEEEDHIDDPTHKAGKGRTVAFEEELDEDVDTTGGIRVKVLGDGGETSGVEDEGEEDDALEEGPGEEEKRSNPETILELAYIREPGLFERDAQTRRGKGRVELREATGGFLFVFVFGLLDEMGWKLILLLLQ
jgi:activating signal cointegrator complex subunit 2